ncbi:PLP-dependent transferase [Laetiporus sulphureus 93-53]|uniref:PLP-dependent transferase n=1 Tax=Laetiporus sulphureus 93-53 TaxID=1314785 RepID=A0A165E3C6_9APHY|nr:PLP-dependent transferase [Laetiporus sulphureus 93-53]KZT06166.1 PLP-dependent transferase [Laetiporus sulphureus 93-53]
MTVLSDQVDPASGDVQLRTYDASNKPPPFGHAIKPYWAFDKDYVNLNHGSYGSAPLPVLFKCQELTVLAERNPDKFHRFTYMPLLEEARFHVADIVGANVDEIVLVPNATHGINTVLRNLEWREGDVILGAATSYGAVSRTIRYLADRSEQPRPLALAIEYTFPMTHAEILDKFRARIKEIKNTYPNVEFTDYPSDSPMYADGAEKKNKFVAVIDSITSNPGVLMPWKEMVRVCKEEGVWSVIDGAHSIGQEMNLNLSTEAKPDFFISNCHKWFYTKRGCALFYVPKRNQHLIKSSIPTSHEYVSPNDPNSPAPADTHFVKQHEWTGTTDEVPFLSVTAAVEFRKWLGGEAAINTYCHQLALDGGKRLAEVLGTKVLDETGQLTLSMTNVLLPLPVEETMGEVYSKEVLYKIYGILREKQLYEWNTYAAHYFHAGGWWCRCSAQVWNEISDFEYLGKAFNAICKDIKETVLAEKK